MLGRVQHRRGVDDLATHLRGGLVHHGQAGAECIRAIDDARVHAALADLRGDLLDVSAIGNAARVCKRGFIQPVPGQDLLGVLADRHVAVAHGEQDVARLQVLGERIKAVNALGVAFGHGERDLVFQQINAAALEHKVQPLGVDRRVRGGVQLVHLLLARGNEQVADCALLDLGLERAGGVEIESQRHIGRDGLVVLRDLVQGFGQARRREYGQLDRIGGFAAALGGFVRRVGCVAAACGQAERHRRGQQPCKCFFHVVFLLCPVFQGRCIFNPPVLRRN